MNNKENNITYDIKLYEDGVYRWRYDLNLFKTPRIFFLVWKILLFAILVIFAFSTIHDAFSFSDFYPDRLMYNLRFFGYFIIGMTVISLLAYLIYAAIMGGKYCVIFEMDEKGINHKQIPAQAEKAKKIANATVAAGAASGRLSTVGVGIGAARTEMYSDFSKVKRVKPFRSKELIKVNEKLNRNQVFVKKEDFEFVENFIVSHCENLK